MREALRIDGDEVVEVARSLIRLDTTNPPGNEEQAARYLASYLEGAGLDLQLQEVEPGRLNLIARLPGRESSGHLVLSGHLDVVPAGDRSLWDHEPFSADLDGDCMIGRGSVDMKGGVAAMAVALKTLARNGFEPRGDLILTASVGEERGGMPGAKAMCASGVLAGAAYLVVGEPTNLDICIAQKGGLFWWVTAYGVAAHSSRPEQGVNAISYMARAIQALEEEPLPHRRNALLGGPSTSVNIIEGGTAPNVIAPSCRAALSIRMVPGQTQEQVEPIVRRVLDRVVEESGIPVRVEMELVGGGEAVETSREDPLVRTAVEAVEEARGATPRVLGFTGGTEALHFCRTYGMPMVIFGPGDFELAHQANEAVPVADLLTSASAYAMMAERLLTIQ